MVAEPTIADVVSTLSQESPTYDELVDLYNELRVLEADSREMMVAQYGLAEVLNEFIDYLALVSEEFEKSIGLTMDEERERILNALAGETGSSPIEMTADIVERWQAVTLVDVDEVHASFE